MSLPQRQCFPLVDLSRHQCRWPVNHALAGELHLFCGEIVKNGHSYCGEHCQKAYTGKAVHIADQSLE